MPQPGEGWLADIPFTEAECPECWGKPDPEWDALEHHMAGLPVPRLEDE